MEFEFHENGVLTGVAGSFCLLCEKYITKTDLTVHIANSEHKERLAPSAYLDKYKDDRIRKVKMGYYCEPCNILIQTSSKVGVHVGDTTHDKNKTYHLVREVDKGLVAFDDILIERQTWNGQNVESCYVCNVEFSDENKHCNESSHILNIIQSKLELKRGKYVYRKIDDVVLNCLICNSLITVDSKESHAEDSDHTNNFIKCQNNYKKFKIQSAHTNTLREIIPTKTELRGKNGEEMNTDNMKLDVSMDNCNGEDYQKTESDCQKIIVFKVQNAHTEHTPKGTTDTELSVGVNGELTKADSKKLDVAIENCNDDGVEIDKENKKTESDCQKVNDFKVQNAHTEHTPKCTTDTELRFGVYGEGTKADSKKLNVAIESCNDNGIETDKENNKTESDCQKVNDLQVQNAHIEHTPQATTDTESSDGVNGEGTKTDSNKLDVAMENCNDIVSPQEALKSAMQFAHANHMKYKRNNTYCKVCNVKIASSLLRLKEHVAEKKHQEKAARCSEVVIKKVPFIEFFDSEFTVKSLFTRDTIINENFCLTYASFQTISQHGMKFRCQICEVSMEGENKVFFHASQWEHTKGIQQASVLTTFKEEFVREIRPGVYHCGFCNFIEASMTGLRNHLKSFMHGAKKNEARIRLGKGLAALREHEQNEFFARLFYGASLL